MGEFLGGVIIFFYVLAILKYVFKWISKIFAKPLRKNEKVYNIYKKVTLFFSKGHRIFGFLTFIAIIIHFIIQFNNIGFSITGFIAAIVMMLQVSLGVYGAKAKNKWKYWILLHRLIAVIIFIAIIIHITG